VTVQQSMTVCDAYQLPDTKREGKKSVPRFMDPSRRMLLRETPHA
jgi:hypothetical protein